MIFKCRKNITEKLVKLLGYYLIFLCILNINLSAQNSSVILNRDYLNRFGKYINDVPDFHTSIKPYLFNEFKNVSKIDSVYVSLMYSGNNDFLNALRNNGLLEYKSGNIHFSLNPLLNIEPAYDRISGKTFMESSFGARTVFELNENFSINSNFIFGNSSMASYQDSIIKQSEVVSGQGYAYVSGDKYKYHNLSGYLSYTPSKYFNIQIGNDKNFIGEGYRSLLLSDNAKNYPFLKVTTSVWKFKYMNLFTNFTDIRNSSGLKSNYTNKFSTIHYLSYNITSRINIGLFETVIFEKRDSTRKYDYDINYLNPIIFFRPVEYSLGSADNSLMGLNIKVKPFKNVVLYGQALIDEFLLSAMKADVKQILHPEDSTINSGWWANKYGAQAGIKWFKPFGIKNLEIQYEFNFVRPFTYSHGSVYQNYGHFNQPLAHPLGANFKELLGFMRYNHNNWLFEIRAGYTIFGSDYIEGTNPRTFGGNIFESYNNRADDFGNTTGQGLKNNIYYGEIKTSYLLNPQYNLQVVGGAVYRQLTNALNTQKADYFYLGISTNLWNTYNDR